MIFQNSQLSISDLPSVAKVEFQKLAPAYKNLVYINVMIFFGFALIGCLVFFFLDVLELPWLSYVLLLLWAILFLLSMYFAGKRYEYAGYALREFDILHKHGFLFRSLTSLPFSRIQHSEISRGPIESAFGLATLRVFTAGGSGSDLAIEGLLHEEALRIKELITQKTGEISVDD